jgi:hypothetical protein
LGITRALLKVASQPNRVPGSLNLGGFNTELIPVASSKVERRRADGNPDHAMCLDFPAMPGPLITLFLKF